MVIDVIAYDQNEERENEIENIDSDDSVFSFVLRPRRRRAGIEESNERIGNDGNIFLFFAIH